MLPNSFILVLRSGDDVKGFSTDFTYYFKPPLKLTGRWQVALTDYIAPNSHLFNFNRDVKVNRTKQDTKISDNDDYVTYRAFSLSNDDYPDGADLARELIDKIDMKDMFNWSSEKVGILEYKPFVFGQDKYILNIHPRSFISALGFSLDDWDNINKSSKRNEKLSALNPPEPWYNDRTICVKTNILSQKYNTLGVFPSVQAKNMRYYGTVVKVSAPIYLDIVDYEIAQIVIRLYSVKGEPIKSTKGNTTVVLHFREV